jgi:hypothetical protein
MKSLVEIGFAGSYKCDLLLYLSKIALAAGKKVAIVDAVEEDIWSYSVPVYLDKKVVTYSDVDIYLNRSDAQAFEEIEFNNYDVVFVDFGFNKNMAGYMRQCDAVVIISDIERNNVLKLREYIKAFVNLLEAGKTTDNEGNANEAEKKSQVDTIKIYRDVVSSKINTKYTDTLLDINEKLNIVMEYIIQFDEIDYRCRIESQYNDSFRFNKLTKALKVMLVDILESCTEIDRKSLLNALKKAERGN